MTDIRRSVLWVVFLLSLLMLWDGWSKQHGHGSLFSPTPAATAPVAANGGAPTVSGVPSLPAVAGATAPVVAAVPTNGTKPLVSTDTVTITTDIFKATLDSQGGTLVRLELLQQHERAEPKWYQAWMELFTGSSATPPQAHNVVLFDHSVERKYLARTGLAKVGTTAYPNHESTLKLAPGERSLAEGKNDLVVRFESDDVGGVQLVKTYTFHRGSYVVDVRHDVANHGSEPVSLGLYTDLVRDGTPPPGGSSFYFTFTGPALYTLANKFEKVKFETIEKRAPKDDLGHIATADDGWIAMLQHYFASAWLIEAGQPRHFNTSHIGPNLYAITMTLPLPPLAAGATKSVEARLFAGPQEEAQLATLATGLELVKDYGMVTMLAKPLFRLLTWLHALLGNWGWSIVALVVLLKIAFYWLNASAYRSMAKMKAVNPRVMEMRERYKNEPQKMQQEMMRLYREEKVNPLGSCLPILVQMPFFIALYWVLLSSVEMRNAPWIGWIHDLSTFDPYYILPVLMTASTLFQTWLNPTPADPVQARMMWIMPLVFSAMFFVFPAGLVLYWLTNNVLSIAQQWFINKRLGVA